MPTHSIDANARIRFGEFEVDLRSHELLRAGRRVRLQEKSFLVLHSLLTNAGQVVTREELAAALWPKEYFVDAEHGLNTAIRRLREALGDSAGTPRWIETLPRIGYRFLGAIDRPTPPSVSATEADRPAALASPAPMPAQQPAADRDAAPTPPALVSSPPRPASRVFRARAGAAGWLVVVALAASATFLLRARSANLKTSATPEMTPANVDVVEELLARARYLRNLKRGDEAKRFVEEALRLDPDNSGALGSLALSQLAADQSDQARETARRAIEIDPSAWEAHRALGVLARGASDLAGAEMHFRRAVAAQPTDAKTRNRLARHLLECGRLEEARVQIVETRRLAPDDPDVQNIWMEYALRVGDFESAIREGESWLLIWAKQIEGPPTPVVRDMLGLAYVGARRHAEALAQFRAIDPDDDLREAFALGYAGRVSDARAILERHRSASPDDPGRAGALAMARIAIGDFDAAFAELDRQLAARWYPGWLHCALFQAIRRDPRWPAFERRLARDFLAGPTGQLIPSRLTLLQQWPRPRRSAR